MKTGGKLNLERYCKRKLYSSSNSRIKEIGMLARSVYYLCGEPLDQDGDQQIEEDIVAKGHEGNEVEGSPG